MEKYIRQLKKEDLDRLAKACTEGAVLDEFSFDMMKGKIIGVTIYLADGRGFDITDHYIEEHGKLFEQEPEIQENFEKFMYDKFGEEYLEEHFDALHDVNDLVRELSNAKMAAMEALKKFKEKYCQMEI